jgi:hypothetical protein
MNGSATAIWIIVAVAVTGLAIWLGTVALAAPARSVAARQATSTGSNRWDGETG